MNDTPGTEDKMDKKKKKEKEIIIGIHLDVKALWRYNVIEK